MNKAFLLIAPVVFCMLLSGCATTGDPNCEGLFCFDKEQYEVRKKERERELVKAEEEGEKLRLDRQELEAKIAKIKYDLAELEETIADPPSDMSAAELEQLRRRKAALEEEIKDLEEENTVLGM